MTHPKMKRKEAIATIEKLRDYYEDCSIQNANQGLQRSANRFEDRAALLRWVLTLLEGE